jgi:hypothetical protein
VHHAEGVKSLFVDQRKPPSMEGLFLSLGTFQFSSDQEAMVEIANNGTKGHVIADAVQFLPE